MTTFVDSTAAGANDGTSWTDAYTALSSATGVAAGEEIRIDDGHYELAAGSVTWNFSNGTQSDPVKLFCVDKDSSDAISTGAHLENTNVAYTLSFQGWIVVSGLTVTHERSLQLNNTAGQDQLWENCTFNSTYATPNGSVRLVIGVNYRGGVCTLRNCTHTHVATSQLMQIPGAAVFENHTFPAASNSYLLFHFGEDESPVIIRNSDVSMTTDLVDGLNSATYKGQTLFQCCKVHASLAQTSPTYRYSRVRFEGCDDGTITVPPLGIHKDYQENGTISSTTVVYRTDGADDGEQANAYSWEMAADASALELYSCLDSSPITTWVEAGAQDITIYVASGGTLNDDDFWIEVESPNETASPNTTAMGQTNTTRAGFRDTPTALTTDSSSTWNGSGVGTKQEVTVSITPAVAGPVTVRCFLAKPSTTVYVDPKISTDGNQRLFEGVQVDGAAAGGGVAPLINGGLIS